ncbi:hypothetical protein FA95DRAFT_57025 [Auriscalpium vulgare]|uniref:Uncharacterized protein n=1 Tax=Auriscalpium vulgare TaxID=40419 RepID=A0ACB8S7M6_9AGAM|nr:hypothetical protein FA95DRAFT_57025 [Auriscalpium vulgare]
MFHRNLRVTRTIIVVFTTDSNGRAGVRCRSAHAGSDMVLCVSRSLRICDNFACATCVRLFPVPTVRTFFSSPHTSTPSFPPWDLCGLQPVLSASWHHTFSRWHHPNDGVRSKSLSGLSLGRPIHTVEGLSGAWTVLPHVQAAYWRQNSLQSILCLMAVTISRTLCRSSRLGRLIRLMWSSPSFDVSRQRSEPGQCASQ